MYDNASFTLQEMIAGISLQTWSEDEGKIYLPVLGPLDPDVIKWTPLHHRLYGYCYNLEIFHKLSVLGISEIVFEGKMDLYIFYHYPGQFLDYNTMSKVF